MKEFIKENDIKVKTNVSLNGLQNALKTGNIADYKNTITWHWKPQSRYIVVIKSNMIFYCVNYSLNKYK